MDVKQVLNYIHNGLKLVLKSLKCNLLRRAETLVYVLKSKGSIQCQQCRTYPEHHVRVFMCARACLNLASPTFPHNG